MPAEMEVLGMSVGGKVRGSGWSLWWRGGGREGKGGLTGDNGSLCENTGRALRVSHHCVCGQRVQINAHLAIIAAAPHNRLPVLRARYTMVMPAFNLLNRQALQSVHDDRLTNHSVRLARAFENPRLAEIVQSPAEHAVLAIDGEAVEAAAGNGSDLAFREGELRGHEGVRAVAVDDAAPELVLLAAAPREGVAGLVEG